MLLALLRDKRNRSCATAAVNSRSSTKGYDLMSRISRSATRTVFALSACVAAVMGCGDDDDLQNDSGASGASAASGAGGASGRGSAGRGGAGDRAAGSGGKQATGGETGTPDLGSAGPEQLPQQFRAPVGPDKDAGRDVFRFETFGNEGFWTRVMQLPQGVTEAALTPAQAIAAGFHFDSDAVPAALKTQWTADLAQAGDNPDLTKIASFNDPAVLIALFEANAVVGLPARNVNSLNGTLDISPDDVFAGESIGMACSLCHSITDGSVLATPNGGGIGKRLDGLSNHNLQVGQALALARNSRAYYPALALDLEANMHQSISRKGPKSATNPLVSAKPSEAEVDAYLNDPELYPVGMFDDAADGNGAPMHNAPFFRTDLAAPWGSEGSIHEVQNFGNLVYTALLDPTDLIAGITDASGDDAGVTSLTGAQTFEFERGGAAGLEILNNYKKIIEDDLGILPYSSSNKNGYPYVARTDKDPNEVVTGLMAGAKVEPSPIGVQVDQTKLKNMTAYLDTLHPPAGDKTDEAAIAAGRVLFRKACTSCHNDDQSRFVPENIVPFNDKVELYSVAPKRPDLFPSWNGKNIADRSAANLAPVRDFPGIFDDKLVITDASNQGQPRGDALPLLMDLARKPVFLHDDSVRADSPAASLSKLLDPARGEGVPHPFYLSDADERAQVVAFLRSLDDQPLPELKQ